jgi:hypothetical protein
VHGAKQGCLRDQRARLADGWSPERCGAGSRAARASGLTRVPELDRAGLNVCFAQDSIVDPWYPLGNGNILRILDAGLHICHMLGYEDLQRALDFVTYHSARTLALGERYGIELGRPASLLVMSADSDYEVLRSQAIARVSVRHGRVIMRHTPSEVLWTGRSTGAKLPQRGHLCPTALQTRRRHKSSTLYGTCATRGRQTQYSGALAERTD